MSLKKAFKKLVGDIIYRLKRQRPSSALKMRDHVAFANIGPGDLVIDCGANMGHITQMLADKGAEVHAFEPNPDAFKILQKRFEGSPAVRLFPEAVLDGPGMMTLYLHLNYERNPERFSQGSSLMSEKRNVSDTRGVEVEVIDLAAYIEGLEQPVKLLKMDVEGAEYRVLIHLIKQGTIDRIEKVLVETHAHSIPSLRPADEALRKLIEQRGLGDKIDLNWV